MPEDRSISLVNLGDISKPADTLIKKISKAVGGIFAPYQIKRIAKAEAEAALIGAQSEIQITDFTRRAMRRWIDEETQHQKNIEDITTKALPQLKEASDPSAMENDWVTNFFDKSRIISDEEMQNLWSRVLAGEANAPGTYSKRTVNALSDLDKSDAELFSNLCGFAWLTGVNLTPLVFDTDAAIYTEQGIGFVTLQHLESIGLVQFNHLSGFNWLKLPKHLILHYYGQALPLEMPKESDNQLRLGKTLLTKIGQELAPICGSTAVDGFWDYVSDRWKEYLPKPQIEKADLSNTPSPDSPPPSTS